MENYNKSFNFRNGVQVDDDNFIVNPNGLVGIGTSVPRELLDVYGTAKVTGLVTTTNLAVSGVSTFYSDVKVGSGITLSPSTGTVSATTFYGSAAGLTGFYAIAVNGWYVDNANSGIYTSFKVGIGTTNPQYSLQVGQNPSTGNGFSVDSITGNVKATGIITASSFSGDGASLTTLNASNISSGTLNNARLPSNISVGIVTATTFTGTLTGTATTASSITSTANIIVNSINSGFSTTGIITAFSTIHVGTGGTAFTALDAGRIGVGTALPTSEFQIRKSSATLLEVLSNTSQARISIGQSVGVGKSTAVLRFGNTSKTFDIINNDTGNINTILHGGPSGVGTGRFAWVYGQDNSEKMSLTYEGKLGLGITNPSNTLHVVGTSTVTGNANFGGNVIISGSLTPGTLNLSQFTGNVSGNINATSGVSTFNNIQTNSNIILSTSSSIGIGTTLPIVNLDAREKSALFGSVGIGTTAINSNTLNVNGNIVADKIGIGTTSTDAHLGIYGNIKIYPPYDGPISNIKLYSSEITIDNITRIGIGTTAPRSVLDFADAGGNFASGQGSFILPPRLTTSQRVGLATVEGAFIYNITSKKFQGYTGVGWTDFN
jgi:hypothetical protein